MKVVTVCSCGLGTCFVLKMKVEQYLQKKGVRAQVIPCDISSASLEEADLYVAPFGLNLSFAGLKEENVIVLQDLLDETELQLRLDQVLDRKDG